MRKIIVTAAAAFVIGGIATGAVLSQAQPAPPPAAQADGAPPPPPRPWMGWMQHRHPGPDGAGWGHREGGMLRNFALVYRQADRQLSPADVQKIAEAFLLWNGNHTWKVTDVAATSDGPIGFSLSTPEGSVVAKFTLDPHTGKLDRVG
nr:hypothetical protein [uncultured Rhodopila sp.]